MQLNSAKDFDVYKKAFGKLTDCDGENSETDSPLDFARDSEYISAERHQELAGVCRQIGKMLGSMINNPSPLLTSHR